MNDRQLLPALLREIRNQLSDKYVVPVSLSDVTAVERQDAAPSSSSVAVPSGVAEFLLWWSQRYPGTQSCFIQFYDQILHFIFAIP